jgi:hypothetical protein
MKKKTRKKSSLMKTVRKMNTNRMRALTKKEKALEAVMMTMMMKNQMKTFTSSKKEITR